MSVSVSRSGVQIVYFSGVRFCWPHVIIILLDCFMSLDSLELPVVCVVFNPHGFKSRIRLYREFKKYMDFCGVKLVTVEVAFKDRPFEVTSSENEWDVQLRSRHILWHKERAINIGIQHLTKLVPGWIKVAWIDADVRFSSPHWTLDAVHALDHYDVIELYSQAAHLSPKNEIMWTCESVFFQYAIKKGFNQTPPLPLKYFTGGHPGLAWAITREAYDSLGGLMDFTISGSGDLMMANALMGNVFHATRPGLSQGFKESLKSWQAKADKHIKGNIGFIYGTCMDYWHGKSENRGYEKRWDIMCYHQFDPVLDLVVEESGLYGFAGNKIELERDLRLSTMQRNEDSVDI